MILYCLKIDSIIKHTFNSGMEIPKLKKRSDRMPINISIDAEIEALYRKGKENGHDTPEFVRQAVQEALKRIKNILENPANPAA